MNYKPAILVLILFLAGCAEKERTSEHEVKNLELTGRKVISGENLLDPFTMQLYDSVLILGNLKGTPILELYNLHTGLPIKKTLTNGRGPLEVLAVGSIEVDEASGHFFVYDLLGKKFLRYDLDKLMTDPSYSPELFKNLKDLNAPVEKVHIFKNDLIGESSVKEGRIAVLNSDLSVKSFKLAFPSKLDPKLSDRANIVLHNSTLSISPDGSHLGLATHMSGLVDLLSISGEKIDSVWSSPRVSNIDYILMPISDAGDVQLFFTESSPLMYVDVKATDKFFYGAFSGKSSKTAKDYEFADTIKAFSWDGKLEIKYHVTPAVRRLAVSNDDKKIYGVSINEEGEYEVVVFTLD